jgi:hypothetical protein
MANGMYNAAKLAMENGTFNWTASGWQVALVNASYTPNLVTDTTEGAFAGDVVGAAQAMSGNSLGSSPILTSNTLTFTGISSGLTVKSIVVYFNNGTLDFLAFYYDTGTGLPLTTTGANVTIDWNGTTPAGNLMTL